MNSLRDVFKNAFLPELKVNVNERRSFVLISKCVCVCVFMT